MKSVPVLIAGAGPAGLTAAITLARHGVASLVVDKRVRSTLPRATSISTRSMELIRSWGLEQEVRAGGVDAEWLMMFCRTLAEVADGTAYPVGYPTRAEAAAISPTAPACVPQDHLEPVLVRHLRGLDHAEVELGTALTAVEPVGDAVRVTLRDVASGSERSVEAAYVIGADGARSLVRRALGIAMRGPDGLEQAAGILFHAPLSAVAGDHRYGIYWIEHPDAQGSLLPAGPDDRWIYGARAEGWGTDPAGVHDWPEQRIVERLRTATGVPDLQPRIEQRAAFTFAAQLADRFRDGRVLLAGDSAHRVTPRGGTGMNTAIAGGFDVGWKLAWILHGWAPPSFLDTYEAERRPIAEHNVARSADPDGSMWSSAHELHADLGARLPHAWVAPRVSTLDLLGPGLTRFTGPVAPPAPARDGGPPILERGVDRQVARELGILEGGELIVRPDGVPQPRPILAPAGRELLSR